MGQKNSWFIANEALSLIIVALALAPGTWAASTYKILHHFTGKDDGGFPNATLIFDGAGNLYGTTVLGGSPSCGCGTVFKLHPNPDGTWTESVLYSFQGGTDGVQPYAGLIFDGAGNLYGSTSRGGSASDSGTVFKLHPNPDGTWTESVLYSFSGGADGSGPTASLIFDGAGNLYGTTPFGGSFDESCGGFGCGVVFKLHPNPDGTWTESVLYSFQGRRGNDGEPNAGLIFDRAGNLYGTAVFGNVFKLTPNSDGTWTEHVLYTLGGYNPFGGLLFDATGNLYGTTVVGGLFRGICAPYGCGVVFKLHPKSDGTWGFTEPHRFAGMPALGPHGAVVLDAADNFYGTTRGQSLAKGGTVFKLTHSTRGGWAYTVLHSFQGKPAFNPAAGLVLDPAGNLYGTTEVCGSDENCAGVVFEITP